MLEQDLKEKDPIWLPVQMCLLLRVHKSSKTWTLHSSFQHVKR